MQKKNLFTIFMAAGEGGINLVKNLEIIFYLFGKWAKQNVYPTRPCYKYFF